VLTVAAISVALREAMKVEVDLPTNRDEPERR